jgi:hypothetical protein
MLQSPEGRELFRLCRPYVKDTHWEGVLFPRSKSVDDIKAEKLFEWIWEEKAKDPKWQSLLKFVKD